MDFLFTGQVCFFESLILRSYVINWFNFYDWVRCYLLG